MTEHAITAEGRAEFRRQFSRIRRRAESAAATLRRHPDDESALASAIDCYRDLRKWCRDDQRRTGRELYSVLASEAPQ